MTKREKDTKVGMYSTVPFLSINVLGKIEIIHTTLLVFSGE